MEQRKITIGHLYPDLLNLYGDRGNIACMMQRCIWRGIEAETKEYNLGDKIDFSEVDIVLLGGGSDREQMIVCQKLQEIQKALDNSDGTLTEETVKNEADQITSSYDYNVEQDEMTLTEREYGDQLTFVRK